MTRFPGEKRRSRTNKQPLSYPTMNIILTANYQIAQTLYNDSVPALARIFTYLACRAGILYISKDGFYYTLQF